MASLDDRLDDLVVYLQKPTSRRQVAMLIYPPAVERRVTHVLPDFLERLRQNGLTLQVIDINHAINLAIKARFQDVIELWRNEREAVTTDIATRAGIAIRAESVEAGKNVDVVIWARVGGAYPFLRVASCMEDVIGKMGATLLVLYPGSLEDKARLRLLDERDGYQYRAQFMRIVSK